MAFGSEGLSTGFGEHGEITERALKDLGFSAATRFIIEKADVGQDVSIRQIQLKRHFDRLPSERPVRAYKRSIPYLRREKARITKHFLDGDYRRSLEAFGRSLHTIQDVFAHSNYCDMDEAAQKRFMESVVDQKYDFPESTMLVSSPFGDRADRFHYSHREHSKDTKDYPEGPEAFKRAMDGAVEASSDFTLAIKDELDGKFVEVYGPAEGGRRFEEAWDKFRNFK
jgi:hypothetical protein